MVARLNLPSTPFLVSESPRINRVTVDIDSLIEMTDPDAAKREPEEEQAPARPPRPQGRTPMSQLEADELYARQLAEHYDNVGQYEQRTSSLNRDRSEHAAADDREYSFIDDDLPVIRENLRKGFVDTQTKVNGWITNLRKRIEDNFDETDQDHDSNPQRPERSRRSGEYDRYDADPQVLSDDFSGMRLGQEGSKYKYSWNPCYEALTRFLTQTTLLQAACTGPRPRPSHQGQMMDVVLASKRGMRKLTCTTHHQRSPLRIHHLRLQ